MQQSQYGGSDFYICHVNYPIIYAGDGDSPGFRVVLYDDGAQINIADSPNTMNILTDGNFWVL